VLDLVTDQVSRSFPVVIAAPPEPRFAAAVQERGAAFVEWRIPVLTLDRRERTLPSLPELLGGTRALHAIVRRERPDVVHLHSSIAGLVGRLVVHRRVPTVFQPNGWSFEPLAGPRRSAAVAWERLGAHLAHAVVCVSEGERERGAAAGIRGAFRVTPKGVDVETPPADDAERLDARARLSLPEDAPLVVCVGRLTRQKGQDALLDAWPAVLEDVADARLVLVGDGPLRGPLESRRVPRVSFAGERDDVRRYLAAADTVVLPSRWDGLSFVLLEAMAVGSSIVATDVAGVADALGGEVGGIIPPGDAPPLVRELARRLRDPELVARERAASRRIAEKRFDVRDGTAAVAALYAELTR
jgi:glycosyltransferase involved in cell wall biosynthesis